jgi:hypothetical protein
MIRLNVADSIVCAGSYTESLLYDRHPLLQRDARVASSRRVGVRAVRRARQSQSSRRAASVRSDPGDIPRSRQILGIQFLRIKQ